MPVSRIREWPMDANGGQNGRLYLSLSGDTAVGGGPREEAAYLACGGATGGRRAAVLGEMPLLSPHGASGGLPGGPAARWYGAPGAGHGAGRRRDNHCVAAQKPT